VNRETNNSPPAALSLAGLARCCILLGSIIVPVALAITAVFNRSLSLQPLIVAAISGGVCWMAAALALAATFVGNRFNLPVQALLIGMLFRLGLPFAALMGISIVDRNLAEHGLAPTILGTYLVALLVETLLAVRIVPITTPAKAA